MKQMPEARDDSYLGNAEQRQAGSALGKWAPHILVAVLAWKTAATGKEPVILGCLLLGSMIGHVSTTCVWWVPKFLNQKYKCPRKLKLLAENWRLHLDFVQRVLKIRGAEILKEIRYACGRRKKKEKEDEQNPNFQFWSFQTC